jgi:predicted DNA-binding protein YlxM (UPF0122 family)
MVDENVVIMDRLIEDLAKMEKPWYSFLNVYDVMLGVDSSMKRFTRNWIYVFGSGLGLPHDQMCSMRDMYIDNLSIEEISKKRNIPEQEVKNHIQSHLRELMSPRAYILSEKTYPMQLHELRKNRFLGCYDNYGIWNEPEYSPDKLYLAICLFDMFDYPFIEKFMKNNSIISIGDLCAWIKLHRKEIEARKAGIGKKTAAIFLDNPYIMRECSEELPILQKIAGE